jgi:hypothetical protein
MNMSADTREQVASWELIPGYPSLQAIYDPNVMQGAQQQLMEKGAGPLTSISTTQGFFPYKVTHSPASAASSALQS